MTRIRGGTRGLLAAFAAGKADPFDANRPRPRVYGADRPRHLTPKMNSEIEAREARHSALAELFPF